MSRSLPALRKEDLAEVSAGKLAEDKATSAALEGFAGMMVKGSLQGGPNALDPRCQAENIKLPKTHQAWSRTQRARSSSP